VLALANAVGAATATREGAGQNVADWATVERLLRGGATGVDKSLAAACQTVLSLFELVAAEP
jgi:hypothetical protein